MEMKDSVIDDLLVVTPLSDRIEVPTSSGFKGAMVDRINQGYRRILLDLVNVDFIDSSGLGAIISSLKSLGEGGEFAVCNLSKSVENLFQLTQMHRLFNIFDSREKALAHLSKSKQS